MPFANTWVGVVAPVGQSGVNSTTEITCPPGYFISKVVGGKEVGGAIPANVVEGVEIRRYSGDGSRDN